MKNSELLVKKELKPCPFCGGDAQGSVEYYKDDQWFFVHCTRCNARIDGEASKESARRTWNSRVKEVDHEENRQQSEV